MDSLNKYLAATGHHLGVESERYGGGFRAIVANRFDVDFLFGMLEGADIEGTQAQYFLSDNPLFPAAHGDTPGQAIEKLDAKIRLSYRFEQKAGAGSWLAFARFDLRAQYDTEPGEAIGTYHVDWTGVVQDLRAKTEYFYDTAKAACTTRHKRDLHALINFKYEGDFAQLLGQT